MKPPTYIEVDVAKTIPTKDNPRIIDKSSSTFKELLESVREDGVKVPVAVRKHPKKKGYWDLRYGERRWLTSQMAGRKTIPALVYPDMGDQGAFNLTFFENFGREDLSTMEEVKAVEILMREYKDDVAAVSSKMGWSPRAVRMRLRLRKISKKWAGLVQKQCAHYTAAHLDLIARLPEDSQNRFHGDHPYVLEREIAVKDLDNMINRWLGSLKGCPWIHVDSAALVPRVGRCGDCKKRSDSQKQIGLWHDTSVPAGGQNGRCLDPMCYQAKTIAYLRSRLKELKSEHKDLVCVVTERPRYPYSSKLSKVSNYDDLTGYSAPKKVKEGTKGAKPALILHGKGMGKLCYVKRVARSSGCMGRGSQPKKKRETLRVMRAALDARRWAQVSLVVSARIEKAKLTDLVADGDDKKVLLALALAAEQVPRGPSAEKLLKSKKPVREIAYAMWGDTAEDIGRDICVWSQGADSKGIAKILRAAKMFGINAKKLHADLCSSGTLKDPAGWANLNADGSPKTKAKKKARK